MKLKFGDKEITIRSWKGKDKKNFLNFLKNENAEYTDVMRTLVYDCIEENVALSTDEFKYVLSRIRALSFGEDVELEFYCDGCGEVHKNVLQLKDIIRYTYTQLKEINVDGVCIKLGDIRNKDFYIKKIAEDQDYDLLLRVKEFNGDDTFTLEGLEELFDNVDISTLSKIMDIYESNKFKIDDVNVIACKCGKEQKYIFDEIPGFLPDNWFHN